MCGSGFARGLARSSGALAVARAWQPSATEQNSSLVPHQPCDEQHEPLPQVVSWTCSVPKSRPQRLSDRIPIQIQTAAQRLEHDA